MTQAALNNWYPDDAYRRPRRSQTSEIVQLPPRQRVTLSEPQFRWRAPVIGRLNEILALPPGWDGYRGRRVSFEIASFTLFMLQNLCAPDTPVPSVVPLSSGGLQVEWHTERAEIELTVYAPYNVQAWAADPALGDEIERHLTTEYSFILPWIQKLG
jgi:hypothetical protein